MIRIDIKQGSPEWLELKYNKIGGTKSKQLFVDSNTLLIDMVGRFLEDYEEEDSFLSSDMERGNDLEPYARKELNKYTGLEFKEVGFLQCEENDLIGISPDGITDDNKFSCELKCPARKKHTQTIINNEIPSDNIHQCLHYFTVNPELEAHFFASFRPENKIKPLFVKKLTRDTLIDLGFKKKTKVKEDRGKGLKEYVATVPDFRTVQEWVNLSKQKAKELKESINNKIQELEF